MKLKIIVEYKKAVLDIPLVLLVQMLAGVLLLILVLLPIYNMFQTSDYNRDVTVDLAQSVTDFVDFSSRIYSRGTYECIEPFKTTYLSNPQVKNSRYNNYVLVLHNQGVGTITFEQFSEIWEGDEGFRNIEIRNEISFDEPISLRILNLDLNLIQEQVTAIFLIPSIEISYLLSDTITGDYKSGYHVYFLKNEGGELVREPQLHRNFFTYQFERIRRGDSSMNLYDFGYYRYGGINSFGPILSSSDNLNLPDYCGSSSTSSGSGGGLSQDSDPNIVTRSHTCTVIFNKDLENEVQYRNSIYWNNGLQCSSNFENDRNFCNSFISLEGISTNSFLEFGSTIEEFNEFCISFYESYFDDNRDDLSTLEFDISNQDIQRIPRLNTDLNFYDYFQRINDEELINYVSSLGDRNLIRIFSRNDVVTNCPTQFLEVLESRGIFTSYENLCEKIIVYNKNGQSSLVFYIDNQDENLRGFYKLINEEYISLYRNRNGNMEFRIGSVILDQRNIQASDFSCNFLRRIGSYVGLSDGCSDLGIFQIRIPQSIFQDISNPEFNLFISDDLRRPNSLPQEIIQNYFLEVNYLNEGGENNEVIRINGRDYILNYRYVTPLLQDAPPYQDIYFFNLININQIIAFGKEGESPFNFLEELDFTFLSSNQELKFAPSFEQILLSMYSRQDESFYQRVRQDIENNEFKIVAHRFQESSRNYLSIPYITYYIETKNTNVPVFLQIPSLESEIFLHISPILPLLRDDEIGFEGNDINILFPVINGGDIILETIAFNPTNQQVSQLREEYNNLRNQEE